MTSPVEVKIDLGALRHNLIQTQRIATNSRIMAMVKGNSYGHGMVACAKALSAADGFGVARFDEALTLRQQGIQQPILVTTGISNQEELRILSQLNCAITLHHESQLTLLNQTTLQQPINVWLKVNTGLNRLGFQPDEIEPLYRHIRQLPQVASVNFLSHLARAAEATTTVTQYECFMAATEGMDGERSLAKSASIINYRPSHLDWIRPGIMLYGISPFPATEGTEYGLKAVMSLSSHLIAVRWQQAGDAIGYEGSWICPEAMPVGIVAIGYGDGYPGSLQSGIPTLINGCYCPTIGRIAMDMTMVDLRRCHEAKAGDRVVLWGEGLAVEKVACHVALSPYNLLTRIGQRIIIPTVIDNC